MITQSMQILIQTRQTSTFMTDNRFSQDNALAYGGATKPLVLVVEAHEPSLDLLKTILAMKGCEVLEADVQDVIATSQTLRPHLIMVDVGRPFEEGLAVLKQMQACQWLTGVPVIITSGNGTTAFRDRVWDAGFNEFLVKPIDFDRLDRLLEEFLFPINPSTPSH